MALPATINASAAWGSQGKGNHGPFESGSNLYVVVYLSSVPTMYKSTDGGNTWTAQDTGSAQAPSSSVSAFSAYQSGTNIYVYGSAGSANAFIYTFSCSSDTWQTKISGPTITIGSADFFGVARSDGSHVIFYQGATDTIMSNPYKRVKVHYRTSGGVWNGPYDVVGSANSPPANTAPGTQTDYVVQNIFIDSSNRVYLFYAAAGTMTCRVFLSTNVFTTGATTGAASTTGVAQFGSDGTTLLVSYGASGSAWTAFKSTLQDTPSWSSSTWGYSNNISGLVAPGTGPTASILSDGTTGKFYFLMISNGDSDIYYNTTADTLSSNPGTPTSIQTATATALNATQITNGIGYIYNNGGTVMYNFYSLVASNPPIADIVQLRQAITRASYW